MYALFDCYYDYHEWMDLMCVAETKEELVSYSESMEWKLAADEKGHEELAGTETRHLHIETVDNLTKVKS